MARTASVAEETRTGSALVRRVEPYIESLMTNIENIPFDGKLLTPEEIGSIYHEIGEKIKKRIEFIELQQRILPKPAAAPDEGATKATNGMKTQEIEINEINKRLKDIQYNHQCAPLYARCIYIEKYCKTADEIWNFFVLVELHHIKTGVYLPGVLPQDYEFEKPVLRTRALPKRQTDDIRTHQDRQHL